MITFLGLPERTAGIIRGKQISNRLEGSEFLHSQNLQFAKNKIFIFIRNHFQNSAAYYKLDKSYVNHTGNYRIFSVFEGAKVRNGMKILNLEEYKKRYK